MKTAATALQMLIRLVGLTLIVLGVLFWTGHDLALIPVHIDIGLGFVLLLWIHALLAARAKVGAGLAVVEIVWGIAVLGLGMMQGQLLPGNAHWLIQALHLLLGAGAIGFAEVLSARMKRAALPR